MKKSLILTTNILLLLTIACVIFVAYNYYNENHIDFGILKWENCGNNKSVLRDINGKILIGPAGISIWVEYPYLYGKYNLDKAGSYKNFIIDLREKNLEVEEIEQPYFLYELKKRGLEYHNMVGYWSLTGQWGDKILLEEFIKQIYNRTSIQGSTDTKNSQINCANKRSHQG